MPDGQPVTLESVPDDVTPEQVTARIQQEFGAVPVSLSREDVSSPMLDTAKVYGSALIRGAASAGALAKDAIRNTYEGVTKAVQGETQPFLDKFKHTSENAKFGAQPRTETEKYGTAALEGAVGGLIGGPATPVRSAVQGLAAGIGAEVGGHVSDSPLTRLLGGLVGGGLASVAGMPKTSRGDLARETLRDATPEDLTAATKFMRQVQQDYPSTSGINLSQAMPEGSNVDSMLNRLANSRYGTNVSAQLRAQPKQASAEVEKELTKLPGTIRPWQDLANNAQEAATGTIKAGYKQAQEAFKAQLGNQRPELPTGAMQVLNARLKTLAAEYPNTAMGDMIEDVRKSLRLPKPAKETGEAAPAILGPDGRPLREAPENIPYLTDALQVKQAIADRIANFGSRQLNSSGNDPQLQRAAQQVRELFNSTLDQHAPQLTAANRAYNAVMEGTVDPLKKSVIGRIAGKRGAQDNAEASQAALHGVFNRGTTPGAARSEILDLEKGMRKTNPDVFRDAAVTWLSDKITAAGKGETSRFPEAFAARLTKSLGGPASETAESQGLKDILAGLARSQGKPDDTYQSLPKLMKYISATSKRPGIIEGASHMDFDQIAGSQVADAGRRGSLINPLRPLFNAWDRITRGDAYSFIDRLITTPEGVEVLRKTAAASSPNDRALGQAMQTFLGTAAASGTNSPADTN